MGEDHRGDNGDASPQNFGGGMLMQIVPPDFIILQNLVHQKVGSKKYWRYLDHHI